MSFLKQHLPLILTLTISLGLIFSLGALIKFNSAKTPVPSFPSVSPSFGPTQKAGVSPVSPGSSSPLVGIMGANPSDFALIKSWGATTVEYHGGKTGSDILPVLESAKTNNLTFFIKGPTKEEINSASLGFDENRVKSVAGRYFSQNNIASNPNFAGYWAVDEPCHDNKWNLTAADMVNHYRWIKEVNPAIKVMINFGVLNCLDNYVSENPKSPQFVDVAMFTVTENKFRKDPNYIANQTAIARKIKAIYPEMEFLPHVAVIEFSDHGVPIPAASWVKNTGLALVNTGSFDGLVFYSFNPLARWMGETIRDVKDDPAYVQAFREVFNAATVSKR